MSHASPLYRSIASKASNATASIVTDSDEAIVVCIEGAYLDGLFKTHPALPGRFFAFLAGYQACMHAV